MAVPNPYVIPLPWKNMLLVLGGGLALWVLPWLAWPIRTGAPGGDPVRKPPVFRYVKAVQGLGGSTWSPVLMPLPTADGFSKKAAIHEMPRKSPVQVFKPKGPDPLYLDLKPMAPPPLTGPGMASLESREFEPARLPGAAFETRKPGFPGAGKGGQVEILEGLKARAFEAPMVGMIPAPAAEFAAISATVFVEIDRSGRVRHALLEQPSGVPEVDAALLRGVRAGVGRPGEGSASGRVRIYFWKRDQEEKE